MMKKALILALLVFIASLVFETNLWGQVRPHNSGTLDCMVTSKVTNLDFHEVLSSVSDQCKVPIGFERTLVSKAPLNDNERIDLDNRTVREVLDALISMDTRYVWTYENGIVRVAPRDHHENLLRIVIDDFCISPKASAFEVRKAITSSSEISKHLRENDITAFHVRLSSNDDMQLLHDASSFCATKQDLESLLNQIIKRSRGHYWIVSWLTSDRQSLILNIF
jgi:hypothetical protein